MIVVWERKYNKKVVSYHCQMQQHQGAGGVGKILLKRTGMRTRSLKYQDKYRQLRIGGKVLYKGKTISFSEVRKKLDKADTYRDKVTLRWRSIWELPDFPFWQKNS